MASEIWLKDHRGNERKPAAVTSLAARDLLYAQSTDRIAHMAQLWCTGWNNK